MSFVHNYARAVSLSDVVSTAGRKKDESAAGESTESEPRDSECNIQGAIRERVNFSFNSSSMKRSRPGMLGLPNRDRTRMDGCGPPTSVTTCQGRVDLQVDEEDEMLETFSDASSDGCSVDDATSWKNDQNRGERLLPLKRLKKGYTSTCRRRDMTKSSDWTDHITIYDKIMSVALDHANYARSPVNYLNVNPPVEASKTASQSVEKQSISLGASDNVSSTAPAEKIKKIENVLPPPSNLVPPKPKNPEKALEEKKSDSKSSVKQTDTSVDECAVPSDGEVKKMRHRRRGRPKGSVNRIPTSLTAVRSYRLILRKTFRSVRDISYEKKIERLPRDKSVKRPVGRPRKCSSEQQPMSETIQELVKKIVKSNLTLTELDKPDQRTQPKSATQSEPEMTITVSNSDQEVCRKIQLVKESEPQITFKVTEKVQEGNEIRCTTASRNSLPNNLSSSLDKIDTHVKDRLLCMSSDVVKRPKGRPRIHPLTMQINKDMDLSMLKRKRGRPPKSHPTLLQSLIKNSNGFQSYKQSNSTAETVPEGNDDHSNSCNETVGQSPSSAAAAAAALAAPNNLLSQLSKRSSLRQVECAFRYREIVVKRLENFIHIVLTSNTRVKNGLNCQVLYELRTALMSAKGDNRCHCVMLSGTGGVFCSGVDLISLSNDKTKATADKLSCAIRDFCKSLMTFTKPLVAAVNGSAVGLGVSMLPYFDLVYATDKATFYSPYAKLGQVPEGGATFLLPTVMGYARANGLLLEGRKLTATEAYDCGIVTQVLWPATFMEEVIPRVQALASRPTQALESTKALVRFHALSKLEVTLDTECRLLHQHWSSDECRQAIRNFLQNEEVV